MVKKYNLKPGSFKENFQFHGHHFMKGMTSLQYGYYHKNGATSEYGSYSAGEMFAEAVADVYSHGDQARQMSIELVKEYEDRQKKKVRDQYNENKKSWWRRLLGL